ncbi:hypothetical protein CSUI_003936 [Cystoisospora suis]|uniref:Uncharacterized protein n=1 Tax=Cystoisospora suis TaxID=483139 RepID=A0A2C6KDX8_9APIC|nr:hypothetical protein CSUI_003936 [Cystoisospora suis]
MQFTGETPVSRQDPSSLFDFSILSSSQEEGGEEKNLHNYWPSEAGNSRRSLNDEDQGDSSLFSSTLVDPFSVEADDPSDALTKSLSSSSFLQKKTEEKGKEEEEEQQHLQRALLQVECMLKALDLDYYQTLHPSKGKDSAIILSPSDGTHSERGDSVAPDDFMREDWNVCQRGRRGSLSTEKDFSSPVKENNGVCFTHRNQGKIDENESRIESRLDTRNAKARSGQFVLTEDQDLPSSIPISTTVGSFSHEDRSPRAAVTSPSSSHVSDSPGTDESPSVHTPNVISPGDHTEESEHTPDPGKVADDFPHYFYVSLPSSDSHSIDSPRSLLSSPPASPRQNSTDFLTSPRTGEEKNNQENETAGGRERRNLTDAGTCSRWEYFQGREDKLWCTDIPVFFPEIPTFSSSSVSFSSFSRRRPGFPIRHFTRPSYVPAFHLRRCRSLCDAQNDVRETQESFFLGEGEEEEDHLLSPMFASFTRELNKVSRASSSDRRRLGRAVSCPSFFSVSSSPNSLTSHPVAYVSSHKD